MISLTLPSSTCFRKIIRLSKSTVFLVLILATPTLTHSQTPNNLWSKVAGGGSFGSDTGSEVVVDQTGNYYITGSFSGSADFGGQILLSKGNTDAFAAKYNSSGTLQWVRQFGGVSDEVGIELSLNGSAIIVAGTFKQTIDFNIGGLTMARTSQGGNDIFLTSIDINTSNIIWSKSFGGANDDIVNDLVSDGSSIFIGGSFYGAVNFNPDGNAIQYTSTITNGYFAKIDPTTGLTLWATPGLSSGYGFVSGLALNTSNLYVLSTFSGLTSFGPTSLNSNNNSQDVLLLKVNKTTGAIESTKIIGNTYGENSKSIDVNNTSIVISGGFYGILDFNPGGSAYTINTNNFPQTFIASYDITSQNLIWAKNIGATTSGFGQYINIRNLKVNNSSVIVSGTYSGTVDFNIPGPSVQKTSSGGFGNYNLYIAKYDIDNGLNSGIKTLSGTGFDCKGLNIGSSEFFISGQFASTVNFNGLDSPAINRTSLGASDIFIAKYDINSLQGIQVYSLGSATNLTSDTGVRIVNDGQGNIYSCGVYTSNPFQFGSALLSNLGGSDIYISKLDASGNSLWIKQIGGPANDIVTNIYADASGVYITGSFEGVADFDIGSISQFKTSSGGKDIFLAKYSSSDGSLIWVKKFGGPGNDQGESVIVDATGVYLAGGFTLTTNFSDGGTPQNKTSVGLSDIFIAKYNLTGSLVWIQTSGNSGDDYAKSISVDNSGIYVAGNYSSTIGFDSYSIPGNSSNSDIFIAKLETSTGSAIWLTNAGGSGEDGINKIQAHPSGLYVTGFFTSSNSSFPLDLNPPPLPGGSPGTIILNHAGGNDIILAKLDLNTGSSVKAKGIGGSGSDIGSDLFVDDDGVYLTGSFTGTANLNGLGYSLKNFTSVSNTKDAFIARYKLQDLDLFWGLAIGGNDNDSGFGITADNDAIYYTGEFTTYTYITPTTWVNSIAGRDALIAKYEKKLSQTISFSSIDPKIYGNPPFTLNATTSSGLPITFTSSNTSVGTINENSVTIVGAGTSTITASQSGNIYYYPAPPVARNLQVYKKNPTVYISSSDTGFYGGLINLATNTGGSTGVVTYSITGGIAGAATLSGSLLTLTHVGTVTITANLASDSNYNATSATQTITIYPATPTLTITSSSSGTYGSSLTLTCDRGGSLGYLTYSVSNGTGSATVSNPSGVLSLTGAGIITITASVSPDGENYGSASVTQVFTINKANPILTITSISTGMVGESIALSTDKGGGNRYGELFCE